MDKKEAWIAYRQGASNIQAPPSGWINEKAQEKLVDERLTCYTKSTDERIVARIAKEQAKTP